MMYFLDEVLLFETYPLELSCLIHQFHSLDAEQFLKSLIPPRKGPVPFRKSQPRLFNGGHIIDKNEYILYPSIDLVLGRDVDCFTSQTMGKRVKSVVEMAYSGFSVGEKNRGRDIFIKIIEEIHRFF
jgi:hypothetical protein